MSQSTEEIRREIETTKARLDGKLNELEMRITDPFQFSRVAMGATASSIRGTVKSITARVQQSVRAKRDHLGLLKQVERHPWVTLGGAALLGYLLSGLYRKRSPKFDASNQVASFSTTLNPSQDPERGSQLSEPAIPLPVSKKGNCEQLLWTQLKSIAIRTLGKIAEESAYRAVPLVLDNLIGNEHDRFLRKPDTKDAVQKEETDGDHIAWAERVFERGRSRLPE